MSELKAIESATAVIGNVQLVYIKEDADKVIAELKADYKEACDRLQTANLIKDEQLAETRHQKYKRCLAWAAFWEMKSAMLMVVRIGSNAEWYRAKYENRATKWLKLAEQFKEEST